MKSSPIPYKAKSLILGCSRLGSALTPLDRRQCIELLHLAYDLGIRDFDTSNIYGQGDSERFLGEAFNKRRSEVRIASKAGQRLGLKQKALSLLKGPVRFLASQRRSMHDNVARQRANAMRFDLDPASVARSLEASLRRLRTDRLDIFYLHSPPVAALADDALRRRLEQLKDQGKFERLGISCDDSKLVEAACKWTPAEVLQFDLADVALDSEAATTAVSNGMTLILRGAVRMGLPALGNERDLAATIEARSVGGLLVGTTRPDHLKTNIALLDKVRTGAHLAQRIDQ